MRLEQYLQHLQTTYNYKIGPSDIHGKGVMASQTMEPGKFINTAITNRATTKFGAKLNHHDDPNAETRKEEDVYNTYALKKIKPGDEITVDYKKNQDLEQPKPGWKHYDKKLS